MWLLSDARGNALWKLDESISVLMEALPARTLAGPNGLAYDRSGNPWVADTDKRRIVELLPNGDGNYVTGREHNAVNGLTIGQSFYPMLLEWGADGRWWVTQAADFSEALSDLVIYDPDDGAVDVVDLPEGAYPTDIAALGDAVLGSDLDRFVLYRVNSHTLELSEFGDRAFRHRMSGYRAQRMMYGRLGTFALAATIVSAILLILVVIKVTPRERRWSQVPVALDPESAPESVPETRGVHWLELNPKMRWLTSWLERVFYILFGLLFLVSSLLYAWSCQQPWDTPGEGLSAADQFGLVLLLTCLVVASFIPMMHLSARVLKRRIGTDGSRVHFELENGRKMNVSPEALARNNRALLYRQYTFPIRTGRKYSLYAEGEVETWLAPLLRQSRKIGEWQTLRHQWKHRDALILATAGAIAFMGIVLLLVELLFNR